MIGEPTIHLNTNIDDQVAHLPVIEDAALDVARKIAEQARSTAPVLTGAYQAGIIVEVYKTGARVVASDQKSAWIEFGIPSNNVPAQFNLRSAATSLGYKFKKKR